MKWLDELKAKVEEMKYSSVTRYWMQHWGLLYIQDPHDTRKGYLDRLIAIAEGAEWGQIYDSADNGYYRGCNLCGVFDMGTHLPHCPYHEDWSPE